MKETKQGMALLPRRALRIATLSAETATERYPFHAIEVQIQKRRATLTAVTRRHIVTVTYPDSRNAGSRKALVNGQWLRACDHYLPLAHEVMLSFVRSKTMNRVRLHSCAPDTRAPRAWMAEHVEVPGKFPAYARFLKPAEASQGLATGQPLAVDPIYLSEISRALSELVRVDGQPLPIPLLHADGPADPVLLACERGGVKARAALMPVDVESGRVSQKAS